MKQKFFEVTKLQLHTGMEGFDSPTAYGVYKTSGGEALGVVGKDFTPTQPKFIYDQFADAMTKKKLDPSDIKFTEIKGGRKVMFKCPVKSFVMKNALKKGDALSFETVIETGYDGRTPTSMFINVERLICTNGAKALGTEFTISFKNVKGNLGKASMLYNDIDKSIKSIEGLQELYVRLSKRKITKKEHSDFIFKVTGIPMDQYANLTKRKQTLLDQINQSVAIEMKDAGTTAWALMNGITHFTNHVATKQKDDFIYADSGLFLNNKAQKFAIELLN